MQQNLPKGDGNQRTDCLTSIHHEVVNRESQYHNGRYHCEEIDDENHDSIRVRVLDSEPGRYDEEQ